MDDIVSDDNDRVKSFHSIFLADTPQKASKMLDCHEAMSDQREGEGLRCNQDFPVQDSNVNFDNETLVQNTIYILSKEMFLDSKYEYTINWRENPHLCIFSIKKSVASKDQIHYLKEKLQESPIISFNINSNSVGHLSSLHILTEHNPLAAHKRSALPTACAEEILCKESARKQETNQNDLILFYQKQDNSSTMTQMEPLDLTSKYRLCVDEVHEEKQHFFSDGQVQREINLAILHEKNLTKELYNHPANISKSVSSYNNSLCQDQSTEYMYLHFCTCDHQVRYNKNISCNCLSCDSVAPIILDNITINVTTGENVDKISVTPTLNISENCTSKNGQNSQRNKDSNKNLFFPICKPICPGHWEDTFIVLSDTESVDSLLIYSGLKQKSEDELQTKKSIPFANSSAESTLAQNLSMAEHNLSSNGTLIESDLVLPSNISAINVHTYDCSKHLPAECAIQNMQGLKTNDSVKILENVAMTSCMDNGRSSENESKFTSNMIAAINSPLQEVPKQDSTNDDSIYLSDEYYDTDLDTSVCNTKKIQPNRTETKEPSMTVWSVANITESQSSVSLKNKLCRTFKPVSESNQQVDNIETESRLITDRSASDRPQHTYRASKTISKSIVSMAAEDNKETSSFLVYPETPEISQAGHMFSESYSVLSNDDIQMPSTPCVPRIKTHTKIGTNRQRQKCQGRHSVFNMGFLVDTENARTAYFDEVNNKHVKALSFRHYVMLGANKISTVMKHKGEFLQSIKHKLFSRKSNMNILEQDLSSEKCTDHFAVSNEHIDKFCEVRNQDDNLDSVLTDDHKTADLLNLQNTTVHKSFHETTEPTSFNTWSPQLLNMCKHKLRKNSQKAKKQKINKSKTLLKTHRKQLKLKHSDNDSKATVLEDLSSSPMRKISEIKMDSDPLKLHNRDKPVVGTKVSFISGVTNLQTSDSLKGANKDEFNNTLNKCSQKSESLMTHFDHSFQMPKTNPALPAMTRCLTLRELFMVKRLTNDVAQQLITFIQNKTASTFSIRLASEVSKVIIFYMCALCSIKVSISPPDSDSTATLQKLKNSRVPTKNDVHQVIRRTRRQKVQKEQHYHF